MDEYVSLIGKRLNAPPKRQRPKTITPAIMMDRGTFFRVRAEAERLLGFGIYLVAVNRRGFSNLPPDQGGIDPAIHNELAFVHLYDDFRMVGGCAIAWDTEWNRFEYVTRAPYMYAKRVMIEH